MATILEDNKIPYEDISLKLFSDSEDQKIIPFLGAGVSISGKSGAAQGNSQIKLPSNEKVEQILSLLDLNGKAKLFMTMAICTAYLMDNMVKQTEAKQVQEDLVARLKNDRYPPSAAELSELFCQLSRYSSFESAVAKIEKLLPEELVDYSKEELIGLLQLLAKITGIAMPAESLSAISCYYETKSGRNALWDNLMNVFKTKKNTTLTHKMLADAAAYYLGKEGVVDDYLIITTNYDCLMEEALEHNQLPYAVVAIKRHDGRVYTRFSESLSDYEKHCNKNQPAYPKEFILWRSKPLVVLYKIHGCLNPKNTVKDDSLVISDSDYVKHISRMSMSEGGIPSQIGLLIHEKPFLFLGYSLNDWNVRSIFEAVVQKRGTETDVRDYSVMLSLTEYEMAFFDEHHITVMKTDLNTFAQSIRMP